MVIYYANYFKFWKEKNSIKFAFAVYDDINIPKFSDLFTRRSELINYTTGSEHFKISPFLIDQLVWLSFGHPFITFNRIARGDDWDLITRMRQDSEKIPSRFKKTREFGRELSGYGHLHIETGTSLIHATFKEYLGPKGEDRFQKMWDETIAPHVPNGTLLANVAGLIAHKAMDWSLEKTTKNRRWTGDWLIFKSENMFKNYMLYMAHGQEDDDQDIKELLGYCQTSFIDEAFKNCISEGGGLDTVAGPILPSSSDVA